jgi:hypothetical protein
LAPRVPTARLQHTYPSTIDIKKAAQEGTSLEVLLVGEIEILEPVVHATHASVQRTNDNRSAPTPTVPAARLQHTRPSTADREQRSQEGTSLKVLLIGEKPQLEPVVHVTHASAQRTNNNRSAPRVPKERLQHMYPSTIYINKASQEGTSLEALLVVEIEILEILKPAVSLSLVSQHNTANNKGSAATVHNTAQTCLPFNSGQIGRLP